MVVSLAFLKSEGPGVVVTFFLEETLIVRWFHFESIAFVNVYERGIPCLGTVHHSFSKSTLKEKAENCHNFFFVNIPRFLLTVLRNLFLP